MVGILLALTSALIWGSADFAGGVATTRTRQFHVLALASISGMVLLVLLALVSKESLPDRSTMLWASAAGLSGAIGIASLYQGLAIGSAAVVAPVAAVLTAAVPVLVGALTTGLPQPLRLAGFVLAAIGIVLVARAPSSREEPRAGFGLGLLAGVGFGGFLILIAQVAPGDVFAPLAIARSATLIVAIVLTRVNGLPLPSLRASRMAYLAGVLDAGGNVFYLLARQHARVDVAAVLSSLYPVATIVLARTISKESVAPSQWFGVGVCAAAVALIAL